MPPCLLIIFLVWRYADFDQPDMSLAKGIDWWGVGLMTVALSSIQYVIEEGSKESWFKDDMILAYGDRRDHLCRLHLAPADLRPADRLKPFQDRNFTLGIIMNFVSGASLFGGTFLMPLFMGQVLRYDLAQVGTTMLVGLDDVPFRAPGWPLRARHGPAHHDVRGLHHRRLRDGPGGSYQP